MQSPQISFSCLPWRPSFSNAEYSYPLNVKLYIEVNLIATEWVTFHCFVYIISGDMLSMCCTVPMTTTTYTPLSRKSNLNNIFTLHIWVLEWRYIHFLDQNRFTRSRWKIVLVFLNVHDLLLVYSFPIASGVYVVLVTNFNFIYSKLWILKLRLLWFMV